MVLRLTQTEMTYLPKVLVGLKQMEEQYLDICKTNNISNIKLFADNILKLTHQYPIEVVIDYANQLLIQLDCFDIVAIGQSLNGYQSLITQLEEKVP
jgi:hypothetical protein